MNTQGSVPPDGSSGIRMLQALRAVACLLVVAYHAIDAWGAAAEPPRHAEQIWPNAAAGVDIFFVVSGFVMAGSAARLAGVAQGWRRFMARRLARILPLYWSLTLGKLGLILAHPTAGAFPGLWPSLASLLFIPARQPGGLVRPVLGVGWTLQFEMLFYAAIAACLRAGRPAGWVTPLFAALALLGVLRTPGWPAPLVLANGLGLEFCLGLLVARLAPGRRGRPALWVAVLLAATGWLLLSPPPGPWRFALWGAPASVIVLAAVRLEPLLGRHLPGPVLGIGDASYAIYLLHPVLVPALAAAVARLLPHGLLAGAVHLAILTAASLAAAVAGGIVLHRGLDAPVQAWLARPLGAARPALPPTLGEIVEP
jgi:peptidoglycan/LPS O-acetylase OafA/YrhL